MKKTALLLLIVSFLFLPENTGAMGKSPKEKTEPSNKKQVNQLPSRGFVSSFDVSPDGEYIVFAVRFEKIGMNYLKSDIWRMNIDGTNLKRLTHTANDPRNKKAVSIARKGYKSELIPYQTIGAERPEFSPKGNFVIYSLKKTGYVLGSQNISRQLMIMHNDGFDQKEIKPMVLSPDETKYIRFIQTGPYRLRKHTLTIFDAKTDKILAEVPDLYGGSFLDFSVHKRVFWSPDSKTIAFTGSKEPEDPKAKSKPPVYLWIVDADGSNLREVTWGGNGVGGLKWSPSGEKFLVFIGNKEIIDARDQNELVKQGKTPKERFPYLIEKSGMWVYDTVSLKNYHIAKTLSSKDPQWLEDGKKIIFVSIDSKIAYLEQRKEPAARGFYLVSPNGTNLTQVLEDVYGLSYTLALDGKYILYSDNYSSPTPSLGVYRDLWLLSLETKTTKKIAGKIDTIQKFSGDYQWIENKKGIVYISQNNLWFMDTETLTSRRLTYLIRDKK